MDELFFVMGSIAGATFAWLVGRRERSLLSVAAFNGVSCGLLGMVTSIGGGTMAPMTYAGFGLVGAAAPLTLCTSLNPVASGEAIPSAVRHFSATLALALVYGFGCAAVGFASVSLVGHISREDDLGNAADYSAPSPRPSGKPAATSFGRL